MIHRCPNTDNLEKIFNTKNNNITPRNRDELQKLEFKMKQVQIIRVGKEERKTEERKRKRTIVKRGENPKSVERKTQSKFTKDHLSDHNPKNKRKMVFKSPAEY